MVGLKVASRKLRELLGVVVLLPEAAQDQVADAVEDLVQQLLLASRCANSTVCNTTIGAPLLIIRRWVDVTADHR